MDDQGIGTIGIIIYLAIVVLLIASVWKVFTKAGKPGWAAIIPIYNIIVLLQIVGKPIWWILLLLIPVVNIVIAIIVAHQLSLSFGKGIGFTIGLLLLGFVFYPILGFGDAEYLGPGGSGSAPEPPAGGATSAEPPMASAPIASAASDEDQASDEDEESGAGQAGDEDDDASAAQDEDEPQRKDF